MSLRDLQFSFARPVPVLLQTEAGECALACIAMVASHHGHATDVSELRKRFPVPLRGAALEHLVDIADQLGMTSRALQADLDELSQLQMPAVLHWDMNHYVVLTAVKGDSVCLHDPAIGALKISIREASAHFTGIALELAPGLAFKRKAAPPAIQLRSLAGRVFGLKRGLVQLFGLALTLQVISLSIPILTQFITDHAIVSGNRDLLTMLALCMALMGVASAVLGAVRTHVGIVISTSFNLQWMSNVMRRLLKLPIDYFERRHLGDIVSRFGAVKAIEHGLTSAAVEAALDGMLAIGTFVMMLIYSTSLASVTLAAVLLYGVLRSLRYGAEKNAATGVIAKQAKEQTYFLETIRGVRTVKLNNRDNERRAAWLNMWVDSTNAGLVIQRLSLVFGTSWSFISSIERALIFWLGAAAVIDHRLSLGMLLAFLSFKEQFAGRINQLIDRYVEFQMLSISAERLADIVLTAPEEQNALGKREIPDDLTLTFDKVTFRYGPADAFTQNEASLTINPGECVAIVGPSGCGKTTFVKLALGILKPASGRILLGGVAIGQLRLHAYRNVIATVMQDDHLFAGSVLDNICFLDPSPDPAWAHACAKTAHVHGEIEAMAAGYHTPVGDMGSSLSVGQKQRVLLARALYRRPKILVLDEATSNLDVGNEALINEAVAKLNVTRIMIAHRPQTIAMADRIVRLENGRFVDVAGPAHAGAQRQAAGQGKDGNPLEVLGPGDLSAGVL